MSMVCTTQADVVNLFPDEAEILGISQIVCEMCHKTFSNTSACRLHRVKTHKIVENEEDKRILEKSRNISVPAVYFHCPSPDCSRSEVKFIGMRNLKQHYIRVHTMKNFACDCGARFALQKDLLYHKQKRCMTAPLQSKKDISDASNSLIKKSSASKTSRKRKAQHDEKDIPLNLSGSSGIIGSKSTTAVIVVVATDDVVSTLDTINRALASTNAATQESITMRNAYTNTVAGEMPVGSLDFAGQFSSPGPSVQHASTYYYPPNQAEVRNTGTDIDSSITGYSNTTAGSEANYNYNSESLSVYPYQNYNDINNGSNERHEYQPGHQPNTRSFGTIVNESYFDDGCSIRHTGTSIDAELDHYRTNETQTPWNYWGDET